MRSNVIYGVLFFSAAVAFTSCAWVLPTGPATRASYKNMMTTKRASRGDRSRDSNFSEDDHAANDASLSIWDRLSRHVASQGRDARLSKTTMATSPSQPLPKPTAKSSTEDKNEPCVEGSYLMLPDEENIPALKSDTKSASNDSNYDKYVATMPKDLSSLVPAALAEPQTGSSTFRVKSLPSENSKELSVDATPVSRGDTVVGPTGKSEREDVGSAPAASNVVKKSTQPIPNPTSQSSTEDKNEPCVGSSDVMLSNEENIPASNGDTKSATEDTSYDKNLTAAPNDSSSLVPVVVTEPSTGPSTSGVKGPPSETFQKPAVDASPVSRGGTVVGDSRPTGESEREKVGSAPAASNAVKKATPSRGVKPKTFAPWQGRDSRTLPSVGGEGLRAFSRPLTPDKWKTLQSRRVKVLVVFSGVDRHIPEYAAKQIKKAWPDVLVATKEIVPYTKAMCEVVVDGKIVASARPDPNSLYLKMGSIGAYLQIARRRRRPKDIYGDPASYDDSSTKSNVKKTFSELIEPDMGAVYFVEASKEKIRKRTALRRRVEAMRSRQEEHQV